MHWNVYSSDTLNVVKKQNNWYELNGNDEDDDEAFKRFQYRGGTLI